MWLSVIVFFTTYILFFCEALIHYNIGHPSKKIEWPSTKEFLHIMSTVAIFSLINSFAIWGIEKFFNNPQE
jgi:hypothetical protein